MTVQCPPGYGVIIRKSELSMPVVRYECDRLATLWRDLEVRQGSRGAQADALSPDRKVQLHLDSIQDEHLFAMSVSRQAVDLRAYVRVLSHQGLTQGADYVLTQEGYGCSGALPAWLRVAKASAPLEAPPPHLASWRIVLFEYVELEDEGAGRMSSASG